MDIWDEDGHVINTKLVQLTDVTAHQGMLQVEATKRYVRSCATRTHVWVEEADTPNGPWRVVDGKIHEAPRAIFHE